MLIYFPIFHYSQIPHLSSRMIYRLTGRAVVEFTIEKGDGTAFSPEAGGEPRKAAAMQVEEI